MGLIYEYWVGTNKSVSCAIIEKTLQIKVCNMSMGHSNKIHSYSTGAMQKCLMTH